ncbi:FACT complex subunit Ssrp1 [Anopheles nili]|uniref:FACT complex subunit Ssrp1 n=1 Tax=Anopheles nili TaxID=185578 RepID=UPI00237BCF40|nr:FACT complex subunit Ssrp1 [Anopheles nili]
MADFLEYSSISSEVRGAMCPGKLKMTDTSMVFKSDKTGKVEQINSSDIELLNYQRFVGSFGLRVFLKNGSLHRFLGFTGDETKIAEFVKKNYKLDMLEKELSMRGWNWGSVQFKGAVLSFDVESKTSFEIPLNHVSQCNVGKNEVTVEFHRNDEAPVSLMEMRFHIPTTESVDIDPVEAFQENVMKQASVISVSGDAIAIFREIHCLTPRGRYDIKVFQSFFQLHGKTYDFKIPTSSVLRLFLLPHKDNRQMFFVISLDPPIKQGQTRYHFLVTLFNMEEETNIELPFSEEELKEKYEDKLTKELSGPVYEVLGKIMKVIINRKLTGPGTFIGHTGTPAIGCSFKAAAGYLYPLERGFIYVHKPPIHIRFEEIATVNFARSGGSTRSFDFEIELKTGTVHTFSSIEKEEYSKMFDFIVSKKLNVKNTGGKASYKDDFADSDNEGEPDAYLARVKAEAKERGEDDYGSDSEESTDEDFNPNQQESDVAEEFDSNVESSSDDSDDENGSGGSDGSGSDGGRQKKRDKKKEKKEKTPKKKSKGDGESKQKKSNSKNAGGPKRPTSAFMFWLNANREQIRKDNPGVAITEISKKAGELWKELKDKKEWEAKATKSKEEYTEAMAAYKAAGGGGEKEKTEKRKKKTTPRKSDTAMSGSGFKSKEFIEGDDSSSEDDKKKAAKKAKPPKDSEKKKSKKSESESGSEEDDDEDMSEGSD